MDLWAIWTYQNLKTPIKGDSVTPSQASLINIACTSHCEADKTQNYDSAFQDIQYSYWFQ